MQVVLDNLSSTVHDSHLRLMLIVFVVVEGSLFAVHDSHVRSMLVALVVVEGSLFATSAIFQCVVYDGY